MGERMAVVSVVLGLISSGSAHAACTSLPTDAFVLGDSIGILYGPEVAHAVVDEAIEGWRRCQNYARGFPRFVNGSAGGLNVEVRIVPGSSGDARCGSFAGSTILLFEYAIDGAGRARSCGSLARNLAHELGHLLGLADAPAGARCDRHVMVGATDAWVGARAVQVEECQAAGQRWLTREEWEEAERDPRSGGPAVARARR